MTIRYPLFKVFVDTEAALDRLRGVFDSGFLNEGEEVARFAEAVGTVLGCADRMVPVNSCTSAITLALRLSGAGPGRTVVTTPMTCVAANLPVVTGGATIKWADVDPESGMVTPATLADAIDETTAAVMIVDWAGVPAELDALHETCRARGVPLIQDAAHAFMAEYKGRPIADFADFTCFSFQAIKHLTCGDGGALVCRDPAMLAAAKRLKWFGYDRENAKDEKGNWRVQQDQADIPPGMEGYKFNMNNVAGAIGLANLAHMPRLLAANRANAAIYDAAFAGTDRLRPLKRPGESNPAFWTYCVVLDEAVDRSAVFAALSEAGIAAGPVHVPNDHYSCFADVRRPLPGLRRFEETQFSLPCGWWITPENARFIAETTLKAVDAG